MGNRFNSILPKAYSKETIGKRDFIPSSQRSCQRLSPLFSASVHSSVPLFVRKTSEITHCFVEFNASVHYSVPQPIFQRLSLLFSASVHFTVPHTSLLTPHTPPLTPSTSHVTRRTSYHTTHTHTHLTLPTSHLRPRPHTSDLRPPTSDLQPQTSYLRPPCIPVHLSVPLSIFQCLFPLFSGSIHLSTPPSITQY